MAVAVDVRSRRAQSTCAVDVVSERQLPGSPVQRLSATLDARPCDPLRLRLFSAVPLGQIGHWINRFAVAAQFEQH
jgi:hypothetical protein